MNGTDGSNVYKENYRVMNSKQALSRKFQIIYRMRMSHSFKHELIQA